MFGLAKVLIIGGGVAGLSAGIYSCLAGHEAIICEKHSILGGNLTGWDRQGYHIDNCIHWLTGTNPNGTFYKMWEELGALGNIDVYQAEQLYTVERDGVKIPLYRDISRLEARMLEVSPEDSVEIKKLIRAVNEIRLLVGTGGDTQDQKAGVLGAVRAISALAPYYLMSVGELAKRFSHPLIGDLMLSIFGTHFGAIPMMYVWATFCGNDGGIPVGSSTAMAERMRERFESLGGRVMTKKEAVKINKENGIARSVCFADGDEISADYIISTCDPKIVFDRLLGEKMPKNLARLYSSAKSKRFSSFHVAFACDNDVVPFKGDYVFELPEKYKKILFTNYFVIREFSHERGFAPEGKSVLQTLSFVDERTAAWFVELKRDPQKYSRIKKRFTATLLDIIYEKFPELRGKICVLDSWTPATYKRFTGSEAGAYMSFILPKKKLPKTLTPKSKSVRNLIFATQWQSPPGGLPIAAQVGRDAVKKIK